jgi:NADP-dependent 3-hydroxy acid dehydrogenase YdfG
MEDGGWRIEGSGLLSSILYPLPFQGGRLELRDKVIVITGASSGFGESIAGRCVAAGARVVLAARSAGALDRLAHTLGDDRALAVPTDVTSDADVARLVSATLDRFGRADALVNNAGFGVFDRIAEARIADLQEMTEVNLYGVVRCTQAFLPHMLARRSGHVVIMSSLAGLIATINMGFYNTSKFALVGLGRTLMLELAGTGVRCALICPNVALTGFQLRADIQKYSRISRLVGWVTSDQVAQATVRAITRRTHGEVLLPRRAIPLVAIGAAFPGLSRVLLRLVR